MIQKLYKYFCILLFVFSNHYFLFAQDTLSTSDLDYNLLLAAYNGNADSIVYWLNQGANANAISNDGISALNYAIQSNQLLAVKALVLNGADVNYSSFFCLPPLFMAIAYDNYDMVLYLIENGSDVNKTIRNKVSPLHYAVRFANKDIIELLVKKGAKLNSLDEDGNSCMMGAVYYGRSDLIPFFAKNTNLVSFPDNNGLSPLLLAVQKGDTLMAEQLLLNGASINEQSNNGYGLIEYALLSKNTHVLNWSLKKKPINNQSGNLIKLAYYLGDRKQVRLFKKYGIPVYWGPIIPLLNWGFSNSFNTNDMLWGLAFNIFETHYGINFTCSYQTRLWANRILIKQDAHTYYQFWETRSLWGTSLSKRILIKNNVNNKVYINTGFTGYISYGKYRGAENRPPSYTLLSPMLECMLKGNYFTWSFASEYYYFKDENAFPIHFKITAYFNIPLSKFYNPNKKIEWK
ncbi:MAG: ankyrin repeat domain-containing protein [Bacteroidales bacterium]|nr:ankyrin repeat domain-containing protein [Bacteroidales bacterium]